MRFGIQVVGSYDHVSAVARVIEDNDAAAIALADHYLYGSSIEDYRQPAYDSITQAAALGRDTSNVEIVMLVSPITFRHPIVYAKTAITIDELSGGRFVLGLGTGWHEDEHTKLGLEFPEMGERFVMLEDALGYLRTYLDDPTTGYSGDHYSFEGNAYEPRARSDLRLLVGGRGTHRTPRLAGTFGGEYSIAGGVATDTAERIERARSAAELAGRNPDDLVISTSMVVVGGDTQADIDDNLALIGSFRGRNGAEMRSYLEGRGMAFRTYEEHRDRIGVLAAAGVTTTYLQLCGDHVDVASAALHALRG